MRYMSELPEPNAILAGYAALITTYALCVPRPHKLTAIGVKHKKYQTPAWQVLTPRHAPENTLEKQLVFALKYEGIDLAIFNQLFKKVPRTEIENMIKSALQSKYMRRIWFLYEYLQDTQLDIPDTKKGEFIPLLDDSFYYTVKGIQASRYRVVFGRNRIHPTRHCVSSLFRYFGKHFRVSAHTRSVFQAQTSPH